MDAIELVQRMVDTQPDSQKWLPIEWYARLLAEMERMLSDGEMQVLVDAGARLVRLTYPEVFRVRQI